MEAVLIVGLQASGKTTFYRDRFFRTHVRLSLDQLRTRHREAILLRACLEAKQPFVVDNTNPTAAERARYLGPARAAGFRTIGYIFRPDVEGSLARNRERPPAERIPIPGVLGTAKRFETPTLDEGFDALWWVAIDPTSPGEFVVEAWEAGDADAF
jgi:hypothetical protein